MAQSYAGFGHAVDINLRFDPLTYVDAELATTPGHAPMLDIDLLRTGSAVAILCALYDEWCEFETVEGSRFRSAVDEGRLRFAPDVEAVAREALARGPMPLEDAWFEQAVEPIYQRRVVGLFADLAGRRRRQGGDASEGQAASTSSE